MTKADRAIIWAGIYARDGRGTPPNVVWELLARIEEQENTLAKVREIIKDHDADSMPEDFWYIDKIRKVLIPRRELEEEDEDDEDEEWEVRT